MSGACLQFPHSAASPQPEESPEPQPLQQSGNKPPGETEKESNSGTPENAFKSRDLGHMMAYPHYEQEYLEGIKCKHLPTEKASVVLSHARCCCSPKSELASRS